MADNDVQGLVERLVDLCQSPPWDDFWRDLGCSLCAFEDFGLGHNTPDSIVLQTCQDHELILITGNRNAEGPQSLEATIRRLNSPRCLPVLTLADAERIGRDRAYRDAIIVRLFDTLINIEILRGSGRLYLP